jgi:lysozyme
MSLSEELKNQIKLDLQRHEGIRFDIYLDTEGLKTGGIGHLVNQDDWNVGDEILAVQVDRWFEEDFETAVSDACAVFLNFDSHPDDAKRVCVNMAFNLGRSRLSKFKNMVRYVNEGNYLMAANEMVNSKWYSQVGNRSVELVNIMKEVR